MAEKNEQFAMEYAFYEIFSSYFKKVEIVKGTLLEKKLRLYFLDYSVKKQCEFESKIENKIENFLSKKIDLKELENKNAKLYILNKGEVNEFVYKLDNCAYKFLLEKKGPENYNIVCNKLNKE